MLLIAVALTLSSSLLRASALEASDTNKSASAINSTSALKIDTFDSNGINNSITLSIDEIYAMPKTTVYSDLNCYGRLIASGMWGGVSLQVLLAETGYTTQTANLQFYASDGYTTTLTFSNDTSQDVIVAYELEGSLLPEILRLVIPNANGEAWISRITSISINNPVYVSSPNPAAASIITNRPTLEQTVPSQPTPTPQPRAQPTTQPTTQPPSKQPDQIQNNSSSIPPKGYDSTVITGTFVAIVAVVLGYLFYKRRK
jgi:DMSO/TMAO reductase YedYZ molybdopterin-dependent catalytic subunit